MQTIYLWLKSKKAASILGLIILFVIIFGSLGLKYFTRPIFFPKIIIWAWERPENLLFINNKNIGVAFYAGTITFSGSETIFRPRLQSLVVNPGTPIMAVVRVVNNKRSGQLSDNQLSEASKLIIKICSQNKISGCQIDFDVKKSEINFYKELISKTKSNLPKSIPLSITTLTSWCHTGSWLEGLQINEVVPMFYRLGTDEYLIRKNLVGGSFMKARSCQKAIGVSVDEPLPQSEYLKNRRIYIFNPHPWTIEELHNIIKKIEEKLRE